VKFAPTPPGISESLALGLAELGSVLAAYIFGSRARGTERPSSDVDIAVLLEPPADMQGVGAVLRVCQDTLGRDDVDVVVLNTAAPILAYEAVSGTRILATALTAVSAYESLVAREFEDEMARLERASSYPSS